MSPAAVAILRAATNRAPGYRQWTVDAPNAVKRVPGNRSQFGTAALSWPWFNANRSEWVLRGVRLDWHRGIAKAAALDFLNR